MSGIDHDGDGKIDMEPDETTACFGRLRAAGVTMDAAWQAPKAAIDAPGRLGGGPLGKAFTAVYDQPKQSITEVMGSLAGAYQTLADNGDQYVQGYVAADAAAAAEFPR
ncbi:hypothetical protein [Amycolatopsis benzoatilytica]|uniref:hypothetical protein n=1 Tax=Amycolatopsis benzoatilytica TaxID=346045 RepID=UPI000366D071|nr:hypothetical protein [Amycolatopsis benzoatilytica]